MKTSKCTIIILLLAGSMALFGGVSSPNGGEQICSGSTYTIKWTLDNPLLRPPPPLNKATIYFSTLAFGSFWQTIAEDIHNDGSWEWDVPVYTSDRTTCRIRVKTPEYDDVCDAVFTIKARTLEITAPAGGEELWPGESCAIRWNSQCTSGHVSLAWNDGGTTYPIHLNTPDDGEYHWTVPDQPSGSCHIVINDTEGGASTTSETFEIQEPFITVTYPNGGETIRSGEPCTITWESRSTSGRVDVEYSKGGTVWYSLAEDVEDNGICEWTPTGYGTDYVIKVTDHDGSPSDQSDNGFVIQDIRLHQLHWHSYHCPGSTWLIRWHSAGTSGNVNLYYSQKKDGPWFDIE